MRDGTEAPLLIEIHHAKICAANACRIFQHLVEHRGQIAGRGTDDLQHFGRCGLLLKGFFEIARPCLYLLEQPRVFDGDDGLVGEVLYERDLLIRERPDLLSEDVEGAGTVRVTCWAACTAGSPPQKSTSTPASTISALALQRPAVGFKLRVMKIAAQFFGFHR